MEPIVLRVGVLGAFFQAILRPKSMSIYLTPTLCSGSCFAVVGRAGSMHLGKRRGEKAAMFCTATSL